MLIWFQISHKNSNNYFDFRKRKVVEKERDVVEEKLLEIIGGTTAEKPPDELDLFFNTIKEKVRKLPEDMQEDLQGEVYGLVGRYVKTARAAGNNNIM